MSALDDLTDEDVQWLKSLPKRWRRISLLLFFKIHSQDRELAALYRAVGKRRLA